MELPVDTGKRSGKSYTLVLVGSYGVGKTTIFARLIGKQPPGGTEGGGRHTIGDHFRRKYTFNGEPVTVTVMDTAGLEQHRSLSKSYFKGIHGAAFIFARDDENSLDEIKERWLQEVKTLAPDTTLRFLVANKTELQDVTVHDEQVQEVFSNPQNHFTASFEVSGMENQGVEAAFEAMARHMYDFQQAREPSPAAKAPVCAAQEETKTSCCGVS